MKTGNLPIRYEVSSTGGESSDFKMICASVLSEGGQEDFGYPFVASTKGTSRSISNGVRSQILSVRLSTLFQGLKNRMKGNPIEIEVYTSSNATGYWEVILQRSYLGENDLGGTPTWNAVSPESPFEFSVNGTTVTSGITISSGFVTASSDRIASAIIPTKDFLSLNSSGDTSDWLHLVVTPQSNSNWDGSITMIGRY
jgi:hypothetical protein